MMKAVIALMKKDLKLLFKDKMAVFFTFVFPLMFAFSLVLFSPIAVARKV